MTMTRNDSARFGRRAIVMAAVLAVCATFPSQVSAQTYRIDTLLGDFDPLEELPLSRAWTDGPVALATDSAGNIFFAESDTYRVRKIDPEGRVTTVAGSGLAGDSGDGGPATGARIGRIEGMAIDRSGNIYLADAANYRIRRVDPSGTIDTIAGTGEWGSDGDGGPAANATVTPVYGLATDQQGNLYISESWNDSVRKIDPQGTISTVAGTGEQGHSGDGGPATEARLNRPRGIAIDTAGILYIADANNHKVRRVDPNGTIATVAGTGDEGYSGDGGLATEARLNEPYAVAVDSFGNIYIADADNRTVRKVDRDGIITTAAGTGPRPRGRRSGIATEVYISRPRALAADHDGELYIADSWGDRLLRLDGKGRIAELIGTDQRELRGPDDVATDSAGNAYVAVGGRHRVLKIDPGGAVKPFAGNGRYGFSGDGGLAVNARLAYPRGVAVDAEDNVYIADSANSRIRIVDAGGTITTIAGTGERAFGGDAGPATSARFNYPVSLAFGPDRSVYVADFRDHRIRRIDSAGIVTTVAGNGVRGRPEPGGPAVRTPIRSPRDVAVDSSGNVYIPDTWTNRVYAVDGAGIITAVAGNGDRDASGDGGPATSAGLAGPRGVDVSDTDTLYIVSRSSGLIRKVSRHGIITTIAGTGTGGYTGDGSPARDFRLRFPGRVSARTDRKVLVVDSLNHRIRVLTAETPAPSITSVLNGASYAADIAEGSVAVILGTNLSSSGSASNELPSSVALPTSLIETSVIVADATGTDSARREAGLYSVSPTEIRFQMPAGTASQDVRVTVHHRGALSEPFEVRVGSVAPGLFTANGDGKGVAAASAVRVAHNGTRTPLEVARYDPEQKRYVAAPLDVGAEFSPVYLTLYGTGIRGSQRPPTVTMRGRHVTVRSSGPATGFHGVDELVVGPIPRSIRNRSVEVVAIVDGHRSNAVTIAFK